MPRYAEVDKWINGKRYPRAQFRRLIVEKIVALQKHLDTKGVRARQIAEALGDPAWIEPTNLQLLAQTLANMKTQGVLHLLERGVYSANPTTLELGLDQQEQYEIMMGRVLEKEGGFASAKTLLDALGAVRGDGTHTIATRILQANDVIRKDYAIARPGLYNLAPERLANLPLLGRWVRLQFLYGRRILSGDNAAACAEDTETAQRRFFKRIGATFAEAIDLTGADAVQAAEDEPAFAKALKEMAFAFDGWQTLRADALSTYDKTGAKGIALRDKGWTYGEIEDARDDASDRWDRDWPYAAFDHFLDGEPLAHLAAPLSFYTTFADWAGLDAAQLSRGMLIWNGERTARIARHEREAGERQEEPGPQAPELELAD